MSIACYQNNSSNCTIYLPEFLYLMVVTLQISIFICCQLIDPCFQAIYFIVLPHAVCGFIEKKNKSISKSQRSNRIQRGPVFNSKARRKNDTSCFRFLLNVIRNPSSNQVRILICWAFLKYMMVIMERKIDCLQGRLCNRVTVFHK